MKKLLVFSALAALACTLTYCNASKKATAKKPKMNYEADVKAVIEANCSPCHIPAKGGRKQPLDSYAALTKNIDDILRRVQLNPTDRGFMPDRRAKLSDSTINILKQWKADGMLEK
jgi:cytochrome c553